MKLKINIFLSLFFLVLAGCTKDNSIVESKQLDPIQIKDVQETYSVAVDEILSIIPNVEKSFTAESDLEYVWYAFNKTMVYAADTLSKMKDLKVTIAMTPGVYSLVLKVTDKTTGIFYKSLSELNVVNDYTPGIMVLSEIQGQASLQFLNTTSNKFIEDVYSKSNAGEQLGNNPIGIAYYPQNFSMPSEVIILCKDERGGVVADPITFKKNRDIRNSFIIPWNVNGTINVEGYVNRSAGGLQDYLIIGGKAHNRATNAAELLFKPAMLGNYQLSNMYFYEGASRAGFYDNLNKRFLCHNNTSGSLNPYLTGTTANIIDPNNVGLKIVYGGTVAAEDYFGVFENESSSERYILRFAMNSLQLGFTAKEKYAIAADHILTAQSFASSSTLPNYLFYSYNGSVYVYNILTKSGGMLFNMGNGININLLKINGRELKIGYVNNSLTNNKGGFATYNITTDGGISASETRKKEGFCDKVIDLTDKI